MHDLEGARKFYHERLGLEIISYAEKKHIFFRVGSTVLLCFNPDDSRTKVSPPAHYGGGRQHTAFEVPEREYAAARDWIASLGIPIIDEVTWKGDAQSFYFEDHEGNVLEIVADNGIWD